MILRLPFAIRSALPSPSLPLHRRPIRSPPASALSSLPPRPRQEIPLFLRPLAHSAARSDLDAFRRWAKSLALTAAPGIAAAADGGPDADHLIRELSWLVQDATSEPEVGDEVRLRVGLEELYRLWRERIEKRRPFQYLVGCEHWRDLVLVVREGVLIPRPETELLVDMVAEVEGFQEGLWADMGTGSGAIAVGIGRLLGVRGKVFATDLSPDAVEVARFNVERYGLKDKVEIREGPWFEPLQDVKGKLAGLVSNPPYIPSSHISGLQAEVGWHEPRLALDGGKDGTDYLLHLCEGSASALKPGGFFAFETNGDKQSEFIADFISTMWGNFFENVETVLDFAGIKRFVTGVRR
ncbi:release factor glutamine methyltransferase [Phoenix dactylifera]|uniref:Release factor glutamine methyltransferase n=1 Tax=Phoenix dactylifera TaxID=42345 RepID=A0A8B7CD72_PHODC|nr:release factor glutamine methyltransferase [Phoenix dactylifera]